VTRLRLSTLIPTLFAVAVLAAGCGSDNKSDSGGGGGGGGNPAAATSVNDAVQQCLDQAKQVKQDDARKTAEAACNAAKSGDTSKVKSAAKEQCLNAVKQIPDSAKEQKKAAQQRCDAIK
jgi:hypothetical protein